MTAYSPSLCFFPDICVVKVKGRDWLQGGLEGNSDGQITEEGQREPDKESNKYWLECFPKVKSAKSVDLTKTNQDIVLNLSLFFALNALCRSVHAFPPCPSWEAWPQLELLHPTLNSQNCWVVHSTLWEMFFYNTLMKYCWTANISVPKTILGVEIKKKNRGRGLYYRIYNMMDQALDIYFSQQMAQGSYQSFK